MAEINPTRINQPKADTGLEMSADGVPLAQMAAPSHAPRVAPKQESLAEAPTVDENGNEIPLETTQETTQTDTQATETRVDGQQTTEEPVTDFTEFLKVKDTGEPTDELQKQKATEKVESEVSIKPKTEEVQTQTQQQKQTLAERKAQDLQSRDLTGLPEDLVPHFQKDMSRAAFDKVKPIVLEHKTLKEQAAQKDAELERLRKGAIPDSYYDNPNGFILDPEYQRAEMTVNQAQAVLQHWQKQYKAIRDGAAEITLAAFDRNGNLIPAGKQPAGTNAEVEVLEVVNNAQQQVFKVAAKAEAIRENFANRHTNALGWLNNYESKAFQIFDTPQGKQTFEPQIKSILQEFPPELRSHPLAKVLAKSIATNVHLGTLLVQNSQGKGAPVTQQQQTKTANGKTATAAQQQRRAGPTVADVGASAVGNGKSEDGKEEVTMEDFNRAKEESY